MAIKLSEDVRNAMLNAIEDAISSAAILRIYSGSVPASLGDPPGTLLSEIALPANWMDDAASGAKVKLGTWTDTSADASGTASHFRIFESTGTTPHLQGTITATAGGGDMILEPVAVVAGQTVLGNSFTLTAGNS